MNKWLKVLTSFSFLKKFSFNLLIGLSLFVILSGIAVSGFNTFKRGPQFASAQEEYDFDTEGSTGYYPDPESQTSQYDFDSEGSTGYYPDPQPQYSEPEYYPQPEPAIQPTYYQPTYYAPSSPQTWEGPGCNGNRSVWGVWTADGTTLLRVEADNGVQPGECGNSVDSYQAGYANASQSGTWEFKYPECDYNSKQVYDVYQHTGTGSYERRNPHYQEDACGNDQTWEGPGCDGNRSVWGIWSKNGSNLITVERDYGVVPGECNNPSSTSIGSYVSQAVQYLQGARPSDQSFAERGQCYGFNNEVVRVYNDGRTERTGRVIEYNTPACGYTSTPLSSGQTVSQSGNTLSGQPSSLNPAVSFIEQGRCIGFNNEIVRVYSDGSTQRTGRIIEQNTPACGYVSTPLSSGQTVSQNGSIVTPQNPVQQNPQVSFTEQGRCIGFNNEIVRSYTDGRPFERTGRVIEYNTPACGYVASTVASTPTMSSGAPTVVTNQPTFQNPITYTAQAGPVSTPTQSFIESGKCFGFNNEWVRIYADGREERTGRVIEYNTPSCGYIAPQSVIAQSPSQGSTSTTTYNTGTTAGTTASSVATTGTTTQATCPEGTVEKSRSDSQLVCERQQTESVSAPVKVITQADTTSKELPKTGFPLLAWGIASLVPAGLRIRKLSKNSQAASDFTPNSRWMERQLKA